ncbi:MAG: hypothetical protein KAH86_05610 [Methanosarcinales archaeon]|nr:hypothetical protein [Methanosarcinales archaeon]
MIEPSFAVSFFANFAIAILAVAFLFESQIKHGHAKSRLIDLIFLGIYVKMSSFPPIIDIAILNIFLFYGIKIFVQTIKYKGKSLAIIEYEKNPQKPKYGINDTIERINKVIDGAFLTSIVPLISFFLSGEGIIIVIGIVSLIIIAIVMANYNMNGHSKKSTQIYPNKIKVNLFTLFSLTLMFSILILISLSFIAYSYLPTLLALLPFISVLAIVPLIYVSNYLLDDTRLTFFRNKDVAKIFVSNTLNYSMISLAITIVISDIPAVLVVLKEQNIMLMNIWIYGFIIFINNILRRVYKKSYLCGLESQIVNINDLKSETSS